jgi:DNA-binding NtrC family response regulator
VQVLIEAIRAMLRPCTPKEYAEVLAALADPSQLDPRTRIEGALATTRGNISEAAKMLGCSRRTLRVRMRELGMPPGKGGRKFKLGLTQPAP